MADEKKKIEEVSETATEGKEKLEFIEIYIRFNDDFEKDYCFQVLVKDTFADLYKIFDTLPLALRPSIFYHHRPKGFRMSVDPGYLTEDGAILFTYDAARNTRLVKDTDVIAETVWPGQLIVPNWERNDFGFYSTVAFFLVWLYTDLPDFISPTPGHSLTGYMTEALCWAFRKFGYDYLSEKFLADLNEEVGVVPQCLFFAMHIFKTLVFFSILYFGSFNPYKPFVYYLNKMPPQVTPEQLTELGWTGARRATIDMYRDHYRDYKIKEFDGMVHAHKMGLFDKLKHLGVKLGKGEGYDTPRRGPRKTLADNGEKFYISFDYLIKLGDFFEKYTAEEDVDLAASIKEYRRYGLLHGSDEIHEKVAERKAVVFSG